MTHSQSRPTTLQSLRDVARPLLIFGTTQDARVQAQLEDLHAHAPEVRERAMQVALIGPVAASDAPAEGLPQVQFTQKEQAVLRKSFHMQAGEFTVILVGKDGGEKLCSHQVLSWSRLAETIDSMPMRQQEMRQP